ncbi:MAG: flagellar assembly protein T N-terminal domain-containing protein [Spirochaetes bacterium]|nr:flagellar assembly protein T N-terminal domain-containing protein [Spirochaetota bacterium]
MKRLIAMFTCIVLVGVAFISCGGGGRQTTRQQPTPVNNEMVGEAEGMAMIFDGDKALARDRAIDDAMNKLVKMKLGTTVEGRSLVQDFALVESIIEASSTGMVRNWSVIKERAESDAYFVTIRGEVYPAAVNETIEATLRNYGRPKFMILIKESFDGVIKDPGETVSEHAMMDIMGNAGFEFVDSNMTAELIKKERARMGKAIEGKIGEDVQELLLDDLGAEVVIIGTAKTSDQTAVISGIAKNMKSKQANIMLKAIDVYTGRVLASKVHNAAGAHIDAETASKNAIVNCLSSRQMLGKNDDEGKFVSGDFMNQITRQFLKSATNRLIMMTVSGLNFNDMTKFRDALQGRVRGVSKVYPRGQVGAAAKIEVEFAGKTHDLAQELVAKADKFGFTIEIKEQKPNKLVIHARKN